jgi:hypothetical protein
MMELSNVPTRYQNGDISTRLGLSSMPLNLCLYVSDFSGPINYWHRRSRTIWQPAKYDKKFNQVFISQLP